MMCPLCCAVRELCPDVLEQRTADVRLAYRNLRQGPAEARRAILCTSQGSEESGGFPHYEDLCRPAVVQESSLRLGEEAGILWSAEAAGG